MFERFGYSAPSHYFDKRKAWIMGKVKTLADADVAGKRVLCRVDFNVPLSEGVVTDDTRIQAALPTITYLINQGAKVILCSHLGRPDGTGYQEEFSLAPVAKYLSEVLGKPVAFVSDTIGESAKQVVNSLQNGDVALLENLRFDKREKKNDPEFAQALASLAEVYVNDAFGAAHRAHASTAGVASYLPAYAGMLMEKEVTTLTSMLDKPDHPFVAILGGSKFLIRLPSLMPLSISATRSSLVAVCALLSWLRKDTARYFFDGARWVERAAEMLKKASDKGVSILLPTDVVCADAFANDARTVTCGVDAIPSDMMGLDIGPESTKAYAEAIAHAKTVFWNGPMGVFEMSSFEAGTKGVAWQ